VGLIVSRSVLHLRFAIGRSHETAEPDGDSAPCQVPKGKRSRFATSLTACARASAAAAAAARGSLPDGPPPGDCGPEAESVLPFPPAPPLGAPAGTCCPLAGEVVGADPRRWPPLDGSEKQLPIVGVGGGACVVDGR
jgi:hypothetical protein